MKAVKLMVFPNCTLKDILSCVLLVELRVRLSMENQLCSS